MVSIHNKEHFRETLKLAKNMKCKNKNTTQSFLRCIQSINRLKRNMQGELHIFPDYVQHSFYWEIQKEGKLVYNGGMELHGPSMPNISVTLTPTKGYEWRIHT